MKKLFNPKGKLGLIFSYTSTFHTDLKYSKLRNILIGLLFVLSFVWFGYIGRYQTIYGAGVMLVPVVLVLSLLPFFASAFIFLKSWAFSGRVYCISSTILFSALILSHFVDSYVPSVYVNIPQNYSGTVLLLKSTSESLDDVTADQNGIAYLPTGPNYQVKVKLGGRKSPEVLNTCNYNQVSYYNADSSMIRWVDVSCLKVGESIDNDANHYVPRDFLPCLKPSELRTLLSSGQIDSSRLKWHLYNYNTESYEHR